MTLGEKLRKLIIDNIDKSRPFFAYVIEQNQDLTWQVQPLDQQPLIYNAYTFQEEADGNKPQIGSVVLCIYIDQFTCYITDIIEYDTFFINTENSSTLYSQNNSVIAGKRVVLLGEEKTVDEVQEIITNIVDDGTTGILLESKGIRLESKENDGQILIKSNNKIFLNAVKGIGIDGGLELDLISNNVELGSILADIGNALTKINTAIQALTGVPPAVAELATLIPKINAWNAN
ncbi:MAG: hypothetical protein EBR27_13835 [Betaproteobacteria bacterium]|nr:hypothetical protein [Betaproteobacteria bacterium]